VHRPKHVEQLRNIGIINSTTRLHLVRSFYEFYEQDIYIKIYTAQQNMPFVERFVVYC